MNIGILRASAVLATLLLAACDEKAPPAAPPPPQVSVLEVAAAPVPIRYQYAGRVAAFRDVEVRARVSGVLQAKTFVEGATVKEGDVLFRIEPETYEAQLARAKAQLQEARANAARTERDHDRAVTLLQRQVGTEKTRDDAVSAFELAKASVAGAEAQVKTAEINLGYATITAPISGVVGMRVMPEGSLVGTSADNSLLTRIHQLDPVYVHFSYSETEQTEIRRLVETGAGQAPADGKLKVKVSFGDGRRFEGEGHVDFTDRTLDLQTGTVRARAVVPNPDGRLRPGEFVRVSVEGITRLNAIVIPQSAVMQGPQGQFVYAVDAQNIAAIRPVTIGREVEKGWIVEKGLSSGDRVVSEGVIKVKPGSAVSATVAGKQEASK